MNNRTYTSHIDHFVFSHDLCNKIQDSGVLHLVENMSDHEPIYSVIDIENLDTSKMTSNKATGGNKQQWKKASEDQKLEYSDILFRKLINLKLPDSLAHCDDVNCKNTCSWCFLCYSGRITC